MNKARPVRLDFLDLCWNLRDEGHLFPQDH